MQGHTGGGPATGDSKLLLHEQWVELEWGWDSEVPSSLADLEVLEHTDCP